MVDGEGFAQGQGAGLGVSISSIGSGGGYGGMGGASSTGAGGATYGSATQPSALGSGGGYGSGNLTGGSSGGGQLRLNVGGALTINGAVTAEGGAGLQPSSGGGSGGSVWIDAGALLGGGRVAADGGAASGNGGGGGGGRIALFANYNDFYGTTSVAGGAGYATGGSGTVVNSSPVPTLQVVSFSPTGIVSNGVSSLNLSFNEAPNGGTLNSSSVTIVTPYGSNVSSLTFSAVNSSSFNATFPQQTAVGVYTVLVSQNSAVLDLYAGPRNLIRIHSPFHCR